MPKKQVFTQEMFEAAKSKFLAAQRFREAAILESNMGRIEEQVTVLEAMFTSEAHPLPEQYRDVVEAQDFTNPRYSYRKLRTFANEHYRDLNEANAAQAFGQLFRVGIQLNANNWYIRKPTTWQVYMQEEASSNRQEFYAPLFGSALPQQTGAGEPYTETRVTGQDIEIINLKWMGGESFDRELFDDDQTGQIRSRMQKLGEGQRVLEEVYAAARMNDKAASQTIAGVTVAKSRWTGVNSVGTAISKPFDLAIYDATHGNRPASFLQLSMPSFKVARVALLNAKDPLGVKIAVDARCLLISSQDTDNAAVMANSEFYPTGLGRGTETAGTAVAGFAGQVFSKNPMLTAMIEPVVNNYLPDWAWLLGEAKKGPVFQRRDPMEVTQEMPNSGQSFNTDTIRYRTRSRWEQEWVDPRFWYQGNDGSVAGTQ